MADIWRFRGFTLIELLVVVVIIAILVSVTLLSVNVLGRDNQLRDETERLVSLIGAVREQAEMQSRDFGLRVYRDGYEFFRYNHRRDEWFAVENEALFRARTFPAGVQPTLFLDAREVVLKSREEANEADGISSTDERKEDEEEDRDPDKKKNLPTPQIFILSSGDLSSFELKLEREGSDHEATILGKADGSVEVKNVDNH